MLLKALAVGANDFHAKPIDQTELTIRVKNLLKIKGFGDFLPNHNQILEEEVWERTRNLKKRQRHDMETDGSCRNS
jgi:putative two-component system response regulator